MKTFGLLLISVFLTGCVWTKNVSYDPALRGGYQANERYEVMVPMSIIRPDAYSQSWDKKAGLQLIQSGSQYEKVFYSDGRTRDLELVGNVATGTVIIIKEIRAEYLGTLPYTGYPRSSDAIAEITSGDYKGYLVSLGYLSKPEFVEGKNPSFYTSFPNPHLLQRNENH